MNLYIHVSVLCILCIIVFVIQYILYFLPFPRFTASLIITSISTLYSLSKIFINCFFYHSSGLLVFSSFIVHNVYVHYVNTITCLYLVPSATTEEDKNSIEILAVCFTCLPTFVPILSKSIFSVHFNLLNNCCIRPSQIC